MKSLLGMLVIVGLSNVVFYSTLTVVVAPSFFSIYFLPEFVGFLAFRFYDELIGFFGRAGSSK